ncbi:MAG: archaeal proteasome endopeptidase complex subunit alpha [Candidatus Bathyarchaeia archaeon]
MRRRITYDRAITIFSPQGRLFQVEYALETVKRGGTIVGITCSEGVVIGAEESIENELMDPDFSRKLFKIDDHLGVAIVGLESDARVLIDQARTYAQSNRFIYDELIDVEVIAKRIGDLKQAYTQFARMRPFGVSILFGGVDKTGKRLFATDPSGTHKSYKAHAIGAGRETVIKLLEKEYDEDMELEEAVQLAVKCLMKAMEARGLTPRIRVAVTPVQTKKFRMLTNKETQRYK